MFSNFTEQDRLIKSKVSLNRDRPFFSYILMNMNIERTKSTENIPTMGVNQYGDLYWNEEFTKKLSDKELEGVLAHEAMHIATLTFQREDNREHMLWNMATDLVINDILLQEGLKLPKDALLPNDYGEFEFTGKNKKKVKINVREKGAEEVYDEILNHAEVIHVQYGDGDGDGYKGSFDSHIPGDKDSEGKDQDKGCTEAERKANEEKWKKKAVEASTAAKMRGKMSASLERELSGIIDPKIDWRKKLHQFITKDLPVDFTMRRPGRRYYTTGVYYPSVIRENLEIIVGQDISGSISDEEYAEFTSECIGIATGFSQINMRCLWWSTYIDERDDIVVTAANKDMLTHYKPHGGGGTTLSCLKEYVEKKGYSSRVYVILTDGYIESKPELPDGKILFVLSKNGSDDIIKHFGEVCKLSDVER